MAAKTGTYTLIAKASKTSDGGSIEFTNIPATYTDLRLVAYIRSSTASASQGGTMNFNNTYTTTYSATRLVGDGSSASSNRYSNGDNIGFGETPGASAASGMFSAVTVDILDYANTSIHKTALIRNGYGTGYTYAMVALWRSTDAINRINIGTNSFGNLANGSSVALYGIEAAK